ncbi:MAG: LysM domain-containing protein [Planctomycetota bacterium]|nr:LysM domain-containing protein [Planctomycetota bacterium]
MVDRVKYFLLGLLFLIVAGVIAYDRWNTDEYQEPAQDETVSVRFPDPPLREGRDRTGAARTPPRVTPAARTPVRSTIRHTDPLVPKPVVHKKPVVRPPVPAARIHVVRSGETLESIALEYYKTSRGIAWIVQANGLRNANFIREKQKLKIPAPPTGAVRRAPKRPGKVPSTYVVKAGDGDLYAICRRFYGASGQGARVNKILEMNGLWSAEVTPGTTLRLPPK